MVVSNISFIMPSYLPEKGLVVWCGGFVLGFVWFASFFLGGGEVLGFFFFSPFFFVARLNMVRGWNCEP